MTFENKTFLMLHFTNLPSLIVSFSLLLEILGSVSIAVIYFLVDDVLSVEIGLSMEI